MHFVLFHKGLFCIDLKLYFKVIILRVWQIKSTFFSRFRLLSYWHKNFIKILVSVIKWFASYIERLFFSVGLVHAHIFPFCFFCCSHYYSLLETEKKNLKFSYIRSSTRFLKISVSQFHYLRVSPACTRHLICFIVWYLLSVKLLSTDWNQVDELDDYNRKIMF